MASLCSKRWKLQKNTAYHLQLHTFIHPTLFQSIVCVWFATLIASHHVLFANRISAAPIFTNALSVTTSIAAAVLTTIAPTVTGAIPMLLPSRVVVGPRTLCPAYASEACISLRSQRDAMFLLPSRVSAFGKHHLKDQTTLADLKPRNLTLASLKARHRLRADLKSRNRIPAVLKARNPTPTDPKTLILAKPKLRPTIF